MVKKVGNTIGKIIILMLILQISFIPIANAGFWDDVKSYGDIFISNGKKQASSGNEINNTNFNSLMSQMYNALLTLGIVLSVLIGAILGIKFMVGSIEQQAKIKEMLLPYVSGCVVIFGAFGIWKLMMVLLGNI